MRHTTAAAAALLLALTVAVTVWGQASGAVDTAALDGVWLVRRAGHDELSLRLELDGGRGTLRVIGRLGRWGIVPDALARGAEPVALGVTAERDATAEQPLRGELLTADGWRGRLLPVSDTTALLLVDGARDLGVAHRFEPVRDSLLGDWERAELHPSGPRVRALRVERERATFWDSRGAPTEMGAGELTGGGDDPVLALLPGRESGGAVALLAAGDAWLALQEGGDDLQVVFPSGHRPNWLQPLAPPESGPDSGPSIPSHLRGSWLVGRGGRTRLTARVTLGDTGARWVHLGPGTEESASLTLTGAQSPGWLEVGRADHYQLWVTPDGSRGALWEPDDHRYWSLWREETVAGALLGAWRVTAADGTEHAVQVTDGELVRDGAAVPIVGVEVPGEALGLATLAEDRSGELIRLWPLPTGDLVADDGSRWRRVPATPTE